MPKADVKLIKTGNRYTITNPDYCHTCGLLDADEYCVSITFSEMPSEDWIKEFNRLKDLLSLDCVCDPEIIQNIEIRELKNVSQCFGITKKSKNGYENLVEKLRKLIDDVNIKYK